MNEEIKKYSEIQSIAIATLQEIKDYIITGATEKDIANQCKNILQKFKIIDCWYHGIIALVLVGERTNISISGKDYFPTNATVKNNDLVTIDLSPMLNGYWADYARSFVVEFGKVTDQPKSLELSNGLAAEKHLHHLMQKIAKPEMTMAQLYQEINHEIEEIGYKNLDFRGNLGHSIEKNLNARLYVESGNNTRLGDVLLFTFEPHIAQKNGSFGFKHENIYYFQNGKINLLGN